MTVRRGSSGGDTSFRVLLWYSEASAKMQHLIEDQSNQDCDQQLRAKQEENQG
jgi:hypothetical protein